MSTVGRHPVLLLLGAPLALLGCGASDSVEPASSVVDSAGIEIVTSSSGQWEEGAGWTISERHSIRYGGPDAEEQLWRVRSFARASDGTVAVLSAGHSVVRVFEPDGRLRVNLGGEGAGPGDFDWPYSLSILGPDTLVVLERRGTEVFLLDGTWLESRGGGTVPVGSERNAMATPVIAGADGSRLAIVSGGLDFDRSGVVRPPQGAAVFSAGSDEPRFVGWYGGIEQEFIDVGGRSMPIVAPFARSTSLGAGIGTPARFLIADNARDEVHIVDGGGSLVRIVRWIRPRVRVEEGWVEEWKEAQRSMEWTSGQLPQLERGWLEMTVNGTLPAFDGVSLDSEGCLWVLRPGRLTGHGGVFDVFDSDGRLLGAVPAPPGFVGVGPAPVIGRDYFMTVWVNEVGVETVRIFDLDRSVE